jgi:hypothetical protein
VEVATGQYIAIEDQRIVGHAVCFALQYLRRVIDGVGDGPEYLWHAAQRIRILDAVAAGVVRVDCGFRQQRAEQPGNAPLPGLVAGI